MRNFYLLACAGALLAATSLCATASAVDLKQAPEVAASHGDVSVTVSVISEYEITICDVACRAAIDNALTRERPRNSTKNEMIIFAVTDEEISPPGGAASSLELEI